MWIPALACPSCCAAVSRTQNGCLCFSCGRWYGEVDGIMRLVTAERLSDAAPFLEQYCAIRRRDGHGPRTAESYCRLPEVEPSDAQHAEWRIRSESFATLLTLWRTRPTRRAGRVRVLDLGAGNGWLSNRLSSPAHDHAVVAVDLNADDGDGLNACRQPARSWLAVQADFDALPFAPGQFDLVVLNASLHYSQQPGMTLTSVSRMLSADGALVVMDSPLFARASDGEAMVQRQHELMGATLGETPVRAGLGFLTFGALEQWAVRMGRRSRFVASRGPLRWRIGRWRARVALGRPPATFGVWMAQ